MKTLANRLIFPCAITFVSLLLVLVSHAASAADPATQQAPAGQVIFAVGDNQLLRQQQRLTLERGMAVYEGDTLLSGSGGHVHLLMSDKGFYSLRPNGQLRIERYQYYPHNPARNQIKVSLQQGVLRAITGKAGQANKQGYRLNTPVAAIGIRGTDFTVQSDDQVSRLSVRSGGVVMAPFGSNCSSHSFGPCQSSSARSLLATDSEAVLELRLGQANPVLNFNAPTPDQINPPLPQEQRVLQQLGDTLSSLAAEQLPQVISSAVSEQAKDSGETSDANTQPVGKLQQDGSDTTSGKLTLPATSLTSSVISAEASTEQDEQSQPTTNATSDSDTLLLPPPEVELSLGGEISAEAIDFDSLRQSALGYIAQQPLVELAATAAASDTPGSLPNDRGLVAQPAIIWGRWSHYAGDDPNYQTIAQLLYNNNHQYAAFNSVFGMLEREVDDRMIPNTGRTFFTLNRYEAYVRRGAELEQAELSSASLVLDFDTARFATHLNLDAASLDQTVSIVGSGEVRSDGLFSSDSGSPATINGVFSPRADEAGFLFEQSLKPGVDAVGATHWVNPKAQP